MIVADLQQLPEKYGCLLCDLEKPIAATLSRTAEEKNEISNRFDVCIAVRFD